MPIFQKMLSVFNRPVIVEIPPFPEIPAIPPATNLEKNSWRSLIGIFIIILLLLVVLSIGTWKAYSNARELQNIRVLLQQQNSNDSLLRVAITNMNKTQDASLQLIRVSMEQLSGNKNSQSTVSQQILRLGHIIQQHGKINTQLLQAIRKDSLSAAMAR